MKLIPAIDLIDGKCVRLTKGDFTTQKVYSSNPLKIAQQFEDAGLQYIHLVDLDGARAQRIINYKILEAIATKTQLKVDFGGGLKCSEDVKIAFENGAAQITGGSVAVQEPQHFLSWLDAYGSEKIILGADCRERKISTQGWTSTTAIDVVEFIRHYQKQGIEQVICTDISKDGMLEGPSIALYQELLAASNIQLIASGGVTSVADLLELKRIGCSGAIIGKAIYEGKITLKQLAELC